MLYELMVTIFVIMCFILMGLILIQKSKGSMGLGNSGAGMQMLFGGSGGQSFFQKATWVLGALFMGGSLFLALYKAKQINSTFLRNLTTTTAPAQAQTAPSAPETPAAQPTTPAPASQPAGQPAKN